MRLFLDNLMSQRTCSYLTKFMWKRFMVLLNSTLGFQAFSPDLPTPLLQLWLLEEYWRLCSKWAFLGGEQKETADTGFIHIWSVSLSAGQDYTIKSRAEQETRSILCMIQPPSVSLSWLLGCFMLTHHEFIQYQVLMTHLNTDTCTFFTLSYGSWSLHIHFEVIVQRFAPSKDYSFWQWKECQIYQIYNMRK